MVCIVWLRRELRLKDNKALIKVSSDFDEVIPLYIVDKDIFRNNEIRPGIKRAFFWQNSLDELFSDFKELGGLVIREGKPKNVLRKLVRDFDVEAIYLNRDYTPYARKRDQEIDKELNVDIKSFKDLVFHEKREILTNSETPYKVFSYYYRKWRDLEKEIPQTRNCFSIPKIDSESPPSLSELGYSKNSLNKFLDKQPFQGGRSEALSWLDRFKEKVDDYSEYRDYPSKKYTSMLSPHLKFGTISIREAYWIDTLDSEGLDEWRRQLCWRDFYFQQLWNWPDMPEVPLKNKYMDIDWEKRPDEWIDFKKGETGFPLVDAGIRQLLKTGWMHNQPRMVVAAFASKDLHVDWRSLDSFFKKHFIDFERSSMTGGIHWCYSISSDSQPYFRVFNPKTQSEKYDPKGKYIKSFIPELQDVPTEYIHDPSEMPKDIQKKVGCIINRDYPPPILDHSERREKAIKKYESVD
ncbi:deoxyribodipyrimidine photo-lyase [Methanonatronarchaeum sp. AMET-Sl]|uniref:cryptochrome/photolyase family protein n=1 Tax=Methanonatronarchaeum sp. AMET-Sl TaxID=3037654 RepID=UPI00244DDC82|nr:deoxyribodipyrimidine photo-lyase [Methanonatronarchaeum sp. AMET-Sl]WGI17390.1 deoxyribodipyrimidine photo-lyase [Methanonatronarchaeum sp. AMET-Sl]